MDPSHSPVVSAREAAELLAITDLPRTSIRRALTAGVAGHPVRTRGALLYARQDVVALAQPPLTLDDLPEPANYGTFVARLRFGLADDVRFPDGLPEDDRRSSVSPGWQMGWLTCVTLELLARKEKPMPMLATCGGFIVAGATILGAHAESGHGSAALTLGPPGPWYADLHHRVLRTPPGRPWTILWARKASRAA
ncbi:hypothetical protein [Nocardioides sp. AE5]|uniref:hypothetical protein n=1 Tax=Nocardioides sp. AE5 TaxID=2962573 RepID=UPI002881FB3A|nr:hypothetical protein [Nocardioides sp. AE5]MDT0201979.1 hypothetical protein [Nocardioides sp. AE5]